MPDGDPSDSDMKMLAMQSPGRGDSEALGPTVGPKEGSHLVCLQERQGAAWLELSEPGRVWREMGSEWWAVSLESQQKPLDSPEQGSDMISFVIFKTSLLTFVAGATAETI